jgi:hypothetical protein
MTPELILAAITLILEKGVPFVMKFNDGTKLENPTIEDFEKLKVKGMREKLNEGE